MTSSDEKLLARTLALRSARKFIAQTLREMSVLRAMARSGDSSNAILLEPAEDVLKSYRNMLNQIDEALK